MAPANWPGTLTELANDVMDLYGEDQVFTDIATDTTDNGKILNRMMYRIIRENQAEFVWPELRELATIATPDPTFDNVGGEYPYGYRYDLPEDYLRPFNEHLYLYEIIGQQIYANVTEDLPFHYIKYTEDVGVWSPQLYQVIMYQLAIASCLQVTQAPALKNDLLTYFELNILPNAKRIKSSSQRYPNKRHRIVGNYSKARRNYGGESGFIY